MTTAKLVVTMPSDLDIKIAGWFIGGESQVDSHGPFYDSTREVIGSLPNYKLATPIPILIEEEAGQYLLTDEVFHRFAESTIFLEARKALAESIADYFDTLNEEKERLSKGAKEDYDRMLHYLSGSLR